MSWLRKRIVAIEGDATLRAYAAAIVATHGITWLYFLDTGILRQTTQDVEPLCWPYFENCWLFRPPLEYQPLILLVYLSIIVIAGAMLVERRGLGWWWSTVTANLFLFAIMSLDYRLRANELYMLFWVNGVFLLSAERRWTVPLIVVSFYFWAGTLKLNVEWLSGAVIYNKLWFIPSAATPAACAYVVFLELVAVWGLLASRRLLVWCALAQLALFHLESLSQIHWFYPALMIAILSWFLISRSRIDEAGAVDLHRLFTGRAPWSAYAVVSLFAACQLLKYTFPGDATLTGQGRILALHMFEARQVCDVYATIHRTDGTSESIDLKVRSLPPRMVCDPIVYYDRVQNVCRSREREPSIKDVDFFMRVRRTTQPDFVTIINTTGFCDRTFEYLVFKNNSWFTRPDPQIAAR